MSTFLQFLGSNRGSIEGRFKIELERIRLPKTFEQYLRQLFEKPKK